MVGYYKLKELGFRLAAGAHVLPKEMVEPIAAATEILVVARAAAAAIVEDARDAHAKERERGHREGLSAARIEAAERLLGESAALDRRLAALEHGVTEIVVSSVRRLMQDFDDRTKAETLVRVALKQMRREKKAELRVSPAQYEEMRQAIDAIVADFPEIELVDVVEDPLLKAPQVIVETSIGRVEADLGRSLDDLERALRAAASPVGGPPAPDMPDELAEAAQ